MCTDRRAEGRTDTTNLIVDLLNFANAPRNGGGGDVIWMRKYTTLSRARGKEMSLLHSLRHDRQNSVQEVEQATAFSNTAIRARYEK